MGLDGEWAALLGCLAVEGVGAFRPRRVLNIARIVSDTLDLLPGSGWEPRAGTRPWTLRRATCRGTATEGGATDVSCDDVTNAIAQRFGHGELACVLSSFGPFCEASRLWDRLHGELRARPEPTVAWAPILEALRAGLDVIVTGPSRAGKTTAIRAALAAYGAGVLELSAETQAEADRILTTSASSGSGGQTPVLEAAGAPADAGQEQRKALSRIRIVHLRLAVAPGPRGAAALRAVFDRDWREFSRIAGAGHPLRTDVRLVVEVPEGVLRGASGAAYVRIDTPRGDAVRALADGGSDLLVLLLDDLSLLQDQLVDRVADRHIDRAALPAELLSCARMAEFLVETGQERSVALRQAAEATLVDRITGLRSRWPAVAGCWEATVRHRDLRAERPGHAESENGGAWQAFDEVRRTADRIASLVERESRVVLDSGLVGADGQPTAVEVAPGSGWGKVNTDMAPRGDAAEAFALAVARAARVRGHQRWGRPLPDFDPGKKAKPAAQAHASRRRTLHELLEGVRIEALLDGVSPSRLGLYRRKAAGVCLRERLYAADVPGTTYWYVGLIQEAAFAATGGGLPADDAPRALRDAIPDALRYAASRALDIRERAAALGENDSGLPELVMELERLMDGET